MFMQLFSCVPDEPLDIGELSNYISGNVPASNML